MFWHFGSVLENILETRYTDQKGKCQCLAECYLGEESSCLVAVALRGHQIKGP